MSRHPYTHACDFVRALGPCGPEGVVLSRSDASQIIQGIAAVIDMTHEDLAIVLSLAQQAKAQEDIDKDAAKVMAVIGF